MGKQITPQEAINVLRKYRDIPKSEVVKSAYDLAISALEKQISKKPERTIKGNFACECGFVIQHGNRRNSLYYCHNCGQAIDWDSAAMDR